jgi:hypothetical protein
MDWRMLRRMEPHKRAAFGRRFVCLLSRLVRGGGGRSVGWSQRSQVRKKSKKGREVKVTDYLAFTWRQSLVGSMSPRGDARGMHDAEECKGEGFLPICPDS